MTIEFRCGQCNQLLRVPDHSAGKNARCPKCQALMQVPAATPAAAPFGASAGPAPPPPLPGQSPQAFPSLGLTPPPPPSPPEDDPFAFLKKPEPKPAASSNPFGDTGAPSPAAPAFGAAPTFGAAPSANPYASPGGGYSYQPGYGMPSYGPRPGLPWERKSNDFGTWWQTTKLVMMEPTQAFMMMRQRGGLGTPLLYAIWGQGIGMVAYMLWNVPLQMLPLLAQGGGEEVILALGMSLIGMVVGGAIGLLIFVPLSMFIGAGIQHLCLKMVGGANQPYETTFRVMCFVQGSIGWLNIVPICGPLVGAVWGIVAGIIGNAHAHECSVGKAVGAFFLSLLLVFVACLVFYGVLIALVLAIAAAASQ